MVAADIFKRFKQQVASDYDEYYAVQNDIWRAHGAGKGMLCIGCLETRIGRKLCRQDFSNAPLNEIDQETQSLRLRDRLSTVPSKAAPSADDRLEMSYPHCGSQTNDGAQHRPRTLDGIYAASRPTPPEGGWMEGDPRLFAMYFCL